MNKTQLVILAACFIFSLRAQTDTLEQNKDLIKPSITKNTVIKGAKIAGLSAIVLGTGYLFLNSKLINYYVKAMIQDRKLRNLSVLRDISNDKKTPKNILKWTITGYASYSAIKEIIKIAKS